MRLTMLIFTNNVGAVGVTVGGQIIFPAFNNMGYLAPQKCEVDTCNQVHKATYHYASFNLPVSLLLTYISSIFLDIFSSVLRILLACGRGRRTASFTWRPFRIMVLVQCQKLFLPGMYSDFITALHCYRNEDN